MYHETIHLPLYQLYQQDISSIAGGCICTIPHLQWKFNPSIDFWTSTEPASGSCKPLAPDSECAHLNSWKHQKTKYHIKACRPIASKEDTHIVKHISMTPQNQTSACKVLNYQLLSQWRSLQDRIWKWGARNQGFKDDCRWFWMNLHNSLTWVLTNTTL
jgi:hypothetical protein